jgi:hypothetical protein
MITFASPEEGYSTGNSQSTEKVHWTRVVHLADNLGSSEVIGVSRMRPVYNRLIDLVKVTGGSAEMYWKGAFFGLSIETHPALGGDVDIDKTAVRDEMKGYFNGLQRFFALEGMTTKTIAPQVVDPTPQIDAYISAICIKLECPKRIFMGSERGELASTQDDSTWNDRVRGRQHSYLTPRIIVPFIDRLIWTGVLPQPKGYSVFWPDLDSLTDNERADVAVKKTHSLGQYVQDNVETVMAPIDYLTRVLALRKGEAISVVEAAKQAVKQRMTPDPEVMAEKELALKKDQAQAKKVSAKQQLSPKTKVTSRPKTATKKSQQPRGSVKK